MATEDQSEGTKSNANFKAGSNTSPEISRKHINNVQLKNQFPSVNGNTPKARKPYTISKQREKWTEEEHKKFIEALKLYGRAWRRIEEHVGTKTAVQIRSHAQKFFCKVLNDYTSLVKPIEIPPPRPKRKPSHPYPRSTNSSSRTLVEEQSKRSTSPISSTSEQDNHSPTSVFSALGSEMFDNTQNCSPSPILSSNDVNTSCLSVSKSNSWLMETKSALLDRLADLSDSDEQVPKILVLSPQESIVRGECLAESAPIQSLKLFGKTVTVSDSHRLYLPTKATSEITDTTPMCPNFVSNGYMRYPFHIPVPTKAHSLFLTDERKVCNEGTWKIKNKGSVNMKGELDTQSFQVSSSDEEDEPHLKFRRMPSENALSLGKRVCTKRSPRGFVPYKRCLAEREEKLSTIANEEREEQRIRLCL